MVAAALANTLAPLPAKLKAVAKALMRGSFSVLASAVDAVTPPASTLVIRPLA